MYLVKFYNRNLKTLIKKNHKTIPYHLSLTLENLIFKIKNKERMHKLIKIK